MGIMILFMKNTAEWEHKTLMAVPDKQPNHHTKDGSKVRVSGGGCHLWHIYPSIHCILTLERNCMISHLFLSSQFFFASL